MQRELLTDWLGSRYDLITASDGFEALTKVISQDPDLVILDLIMPRVSGYELLSALRRAHMDVPVLVSSSRLQTAGDRLGPLVLGATDFLPKPVNRIELEHKVETLLRLRRVRDHRFDGAEVEELFGRVSALRLLEAPEFRERTARAVEFGQRNGLPSSIASLRAGAERELDAWIDAANEDLRFEDAVLRRGKLGAVVLLVATPPNEAPKVLERTTARCIELSGLHPELRIEIVQAEDWLQLEALDLDEPAAASEA
jgi:CheY-like chemotaxis protein